MDERHWWFATKLQETFHIGAQDSPTMLEDFMAEQATLDYINDFLAVGGHTKLFFYCPKPSQETLVARKMSVTNTTAKLREVLNEESICLYFLRSEADHVIESNRVEKEVFCGEIKEGPLLTLNLLVSDIFAPILRAQKNWDCSDENVAQFLTQFEKLASTLNEYATASVAPQPILKRAEMQVSNDFKQNRAAAINPMVLSEYETLVTDWMHTIEGILCDGLDDRALDGMRGPLTESHLWHRRQKHLIGITEQLKTKECKGVIAILITGKSKILKRWKVIDTSITDAFNETKDKVKYLDSLKRYFEQLYLPNITVSTLSNSVLPGLMATVRQMDAISRYYARTGYLGVLFTKVTNQLVHALQQYVSTSITQVEEDRLWQVVEHEVKRLHGGQSALTYMKTKNKKKQGGAEAKHGTQDDHFSARLNSCLLLQKQYRDMIRTLRDNFGAASSHSTTGLFSGTPAQPNSVKRSFLHPGNIVGSQSSTLRLPSNMSTQGNVRHRDSDSTSFQGVAGVSLADEDTVFTSMEFFCTRVRNMLDIINTLAQFAKLCEAVKDLPRLPREALAPEEEITGEDEGDEDQGRDISRTISDTSFEEEEEVIIEDPPSIWSELEDMLQDMRDSLVRSITAQSFLDILGKDREKFELGYSAYVNNVHKIEAYICQYIEGIFTLKLSVERSLQILSRFECVVNRPGLRNMFSEKYVAVFSNFEDVLEKVQNLYETQKESPPLSRNAPMVSGAISWSRGLLRKIEEPMKIFKENKFITSFRDFGRIAKFYNRIATALVKFESLWLTMWKSRIESAKVALKLPLLTHHFETKELLVNADERVVELIQECKGLLRFGIQLPENALDVFRQENRFKNYKQHLEFVLKDYSSICALVAEPLKKLLLPHMESVIQYLQPGLSTLAWNSMNIDAYLHQVHLANGRLRVVVESVNKVVVDGIHKSIAFLEKSTLFDVDLAYQKRWEADQFKDELKKDIKDKQTKLSSLLKSVENSIQEVISLAAYHRSVSPISPSHTPRLSMSPRSIRPGISGVRAGTSVSGVTEESIIGEIYTHYCGLAHKALLQCIQRSLEVLYHSVCPVEMIKDIDNGSEINSRPSSAASTLSSSSEWAVPHPPSDLLQFEVEIKFNIPDIVIVPTLTLVQSAVNDVATCLVDVCKDIQWWAIDTKETLYQSISQNSTVSSLVRYISDVITCLQNSVDRQLLRFHRYDFLWEEDMHALYHAFVDTEPSQAEFRKEVDRLQSIEKDIYAIPDLLTIGSVSLNTTPVKDSLHGLAVAWKKKYSTELHEIAKADLQQLVEYREEMEKRLSYKVVSLENLNETLNLLQELSDRDNTIDEVYLPVENSYIMLREYQLALPRKEVEEVNNLRDRWRALMDLADKVQSELMIEKRHIFEQELDKDVKRFVVEVIQFRNSFDSQGPGVPGVLPAVAVERLHNFQNAYSEYEAKRKILDAVQLLFGVTPTHYPELDRTGEELVLLGLLYGLFQQYISFDQSFREKLWADVDLISANREVESDWQQCLRLPERIQEWQAYKDMKSYIKEYLDVFPILHKLASKEIRNRHWLQVMSVTGSSFQLEANVFKLKYLLDIELINHQDEIKDICSSASRELELEVKMRSTEEEWTEQVLQFEKFKDGAMYCLSNQHTEGLLELLEDAQSSLAMMLTSKYIGPLQHEAAAWAMKLKEISEVLEQWLAVQDFWRYLEAVFSNPITAKELPHEFARFARVDKSYMKMTKRAHDTKNVLQCCVGGDVPKIQVLKHLYEELEICFKSLQAYLNARRKVFPRFYFVSDLVLLAILSQPYTLDSVKPHLKSLFVGLTDITLTPRPDGVKSAWNMAVLNVKKTIKEDEEQPTSNLIIPPYRKVSQNLQSEHDLSRAISRNLSTCVSSSSYNEWRIVLSDAVAVTSEKGETLELKKEVFLHGGVELWLSELSRVLQETVHDAVVNCVEDAKTFNYIDEIAQKYPPQIACLGLLYMWTRECEAGIADIRIDRKALPNAIRRFWSILSRLPNILIKGSWRNIDQNLTVASHAKLEALLSYGMYLRDIVDDLGKRKLRDVTDFEWKRNMRFYGNICEEGRDGKPHALLHLLENVLEYGNEFYGSRMPIILTPLTERCFLTLIKATTEFQCGAIVGESGTGKTETAKGLAHMLGQYFVSLSCTPKMDFGQVAKILTGLAQEGCWGILDEFHHAPPAVVSVIFHYVQTVIDALKVGQTSCYVNEGKEIVIKPTFNILVTATSDSQDFTMVTELKAYFRTVTMVMPDMPLILRAHCAGQGLKSPKVLADRFTMVAKICQAQLSSTTAKIFSLSSLISVVKTLGAIHRSQNTNNQNKISMMTSDFQMRPTSNTSMLRSSKFTGDKEKKAASPSGLTTAAKLDHSCAMQVLQQCIGPRLSQEDLGIFNSVLRDVFNGLPRLPYATDQHIMNDRSFESLLMKYASENGLVARPQWMDKVLQLYHLSENNHGIIVAGGPGSGKTSCITSLVETLARWSLVKHGNTGAQVHAHKLHRINSLAVSDLSLMFGQLGPNGDWLDGIFTSYWRKANKEHNVHRTTTWLCLDAPLHQGWAENLSSVLDNGKYLTLENCERLHLADDVRIVFETDDLENASPAILSRTAMVFMDDDVLGWQPLAEAWLNERSSAMERKCLQKAFNNTLDPMSHFVLHDSKPLMRICEVGLFSTCLALLEALMHNNTDISGELHIERLYMFSLIWSFGVLLDDQDRKKFGDLLLTLTTGLPDYDQDISVFDYYLDESGEWELWRSRVPDESYFDAADLLGEVFVETDQTIRIRLLMELVRMSGRNILLVGPEGAGKSCLVNDFLDKQVTEDKKLMVRRFVYSSNSTASSLQRFIESNIHHRQGYDYGARGGKTLSVFIEDLNLPEADIYGVQEVNELLRQVLDYRALYKLQKPFEWRLLEDLVVVATMNTSFKPPATGFHTPISKRLKRHFAVFRLPTPVAKTLFSIVTCVLEGNMSHNQGMGLQQELHEQITEVTCSLIESVQDALRASPTPGRLHYHFNLRDVSRVFQGLKNCPEEMRADEDYVVSLWQHEVQRVMGDRISRSDDSTWFERKVKDLTKTYFPEKLANSPSQFFVTFNTDTKEFYTGRGVTSTKITIKPTHQAVVSLDEVIPCLDTYLSRYNDEFSTSPLNLMLSSHVISHLVRIHRILSIKNSGNVLLVGPIGSQLSDLAALALYMLEYPIHTIDCSYRGSFLDGLRSAVRRAGCDGKTTTIIIKDREILDDSYLDAINSLLISGEYPPLFSEDEINSLLQALMPSIKRKFSSFLTDPMKFFLTRVKRNLHIILCLQPTHKVLSSASSHYPGILSKCHINWVKHWGEEALVGKAKHFLQRHSLFQDDASSVLRPSVVATLASIHEFVLQDCHHIPWAGGMAINPETKSKTKDLKQAGNETNDPYGRNLLMERIALANRQVDVAMPNEVFVGPTTYDRFLQCFMSLLKKKEGEIKNLLNDSRLCLNTLCEARKDADKLKHYITKTKSEFEEANVTTAKLLDDLTAKSTVLEKLKAKLGVGSDTLRSFIAMIDNEIDDDDSYLFVDEEKDELDEDFERIQVAKMKSRKAKTVEEITMAERERERLKEELDEAEDQVLIWQERLDRTCCERLKAIQNPPTMIGMVMLMAMVLLGKQEFSPHSSGAASSIRHERKSFDGGTIADDTSSSGGHSKKRNRLEPGQPRAPPQPTYAGLSSDGKMDRHTWKAIQMIMSDSQKFSDALHGVSWQEGLSEDIVRSVEPFFAKNEVGELGQPLQGNIAKAGTPPGKVSPTTERRHSHGITVTAARYASEDAVILVEYVLALLEHTKKYRPYKRMLDYITELSAEQEEHERVVDDERYSEDDLQEEKPAESDPGPELTAEDLPSLEEELQTLQDDFDKAVMVKYDLQDEVNASSERLRVAQELLQRLRDFEEDSRLFVVEYSSSEVLLSNCMSAAAFLTYCGPMGIDQRKKMVAYFTNASLKHGLPKESKQVFYDFPLCEYLNGKLALKMLQQSKALTDPLSLDNSCLVNQEETANTWPLICDPQHVAQSLVTALNQVTIVKFKELRGHLETCLMEGTQLFVTHVDLTALVEDDRFYYVLRSVPTFLKARNPFKLLVGEHEIECQPSFRLFMSTTVPAYRVPAQLSAFINVIDMCLSRDGLEEMFLDRFMELEKPRIQDSRLQSVSEIVRLLKMKDESERKFLEVLLKNRQFLHDLSTMKKISSIRKNFEETVESITRAEQSEASLLHSREAFRPIARRAAVLFDVTRHMGEVNEKYTISLAQFLKIFDTAIQHSERTAVKAVAERVGQSAFFFAVQGFLEKDRKLFALLSAIEVEDSFGRVSPGDREFLIYPAYGSAVKTALNHGAMVTTSQLRIINAKKPFDWMTDEQYSGLQLLAQSFDWFQDAFEKMTKDGRETQWRQLVEHEIPELVALPDNLDEKFNPMQRFMIIRAIRPDRLIQISRSFIIQGLGRRYTSDLPLDLGFVHRQSDSKTPVLLLYDEESAILETFVKDLAGKKQVDLSVVHLSSGCSNEERYARRSLHKAMTEGTWLLLLDGHNSPRLLDMLDSLISDSKQIEVNFRLWISAKISSPLPCSLLQLTVKVVADSPKNIRDNLVRSMSLVDSDILGSSSRTEWPALLHNVCVLHNVVRLRSQYQLVGWNAPAVINPGALELSDAIRVAAREFGEHNSHEHSTTPVTTAGKAIQWNALRYMLSEVVYGKGIQDEFDHQSLSAMVDYWISPAAVKKEFEASRVKYRLPSVFFSGNVRLPSLVQSLESLPANVLDVPEACGLHSSPETVVAHDQYIFTRLNWIYDRMPVTDTLTHACVESDFYTPTKGVVVVSGQTQLPGASFLAVEKSGLFASASLWALRHRKDVDLFEICTTALNKVPKPWSKESINEKLKKVGVTSFSLFVLSEVEQMQRLIQTIRDDLQVIKTSVSDGIHGDLVPPDVLEVATALYHLRIPSRWLQLAGDSSPPGSWSLVAWLTDLQSRHAHIERVVTQGRDRVPAYWLGAFFNPKRLLAIVKQEAIRNFESSGRSSVMELFVLQSDITGRDKDHLREPPLEGIFIYGLYMWGCAWEKTTGDLMDSPPRHGPTPLPVVHLTVVPQSEKHSLHDPQKAAVSYSCPCYPSRICPREPVLLLDIDNKDVSASRWPLRGLCATLRPF